jgi:hypothetical protein
MKGGAEEFLDAEAQRRGEEEKEEWEGGEGWG